MARPHRQPSSSPPDPTGLARPWLASYPPGVPPTYELPHVPLTRLLDDAARDFPERTALLVDGRSTTYVALRDQVDGLASELLGLGLAADDRVLVAVPTTEVAPTVLFALWRLGAVAVPVDPNLRPDLLVAVARDAEVDALVGTDAACSALQQDDASPPLVVTVDGDEYRGGSRRLRDRLPRAPRLPRLRRAPRPATGDGAGSPGTVALRDLAGPRISRTTPAPPAPEAPALLAYRPRARELRGVVLAHRQLLANAFQARLWAPDVQAGRERVLVADPLHLTVPLTLGVLTGILSAATLVLLDGPDAAALARAIERDRPTLWPTLPDRLSKVLDPDQAGRRDLTSLRLVVTGGAPLSPQVAADLERRTGGARVREGYGLAEASPLTHAQPVYGKVVPGSIGLPVTETVAIVVDPDDLATVRPTGEPGMLLVHGPQVASGYWRRPDATTAAFRDGWLVTGDLATVDADGVFRVVGRIDEVVRRDDELVAPRAVEAILRRHPSVAAAGVVVAGEDGPFVAAVVARRRRRVDTDAVLAHCHAHLPPEAIPDRIEVVDALPEDDAGELARDQLARDLVGADPTEGG